MKIKALGFLAVLLLAVSPAHADPMMVNGWDMSYFETGFPFIAPSDFSGQYGANWSDLDASSNPGIGLVDSANFGTMIWDGTAGSTNQIPTGAADTLFTSEGSLEANRTRPAAGTMDSTAQLPLQSDGQDAWTDLKLNTQDVMSIVFKSDLSSIPETGSDWLLSFAARTQFTGQTSMLTVDFSTDGVNYSSAQQFQIDDVDTLYEVSLGGTGLNMAFARITFDETATFLDNVATDAELSSVPEPGTLLLMVSGLGGLTAFSRRRAA